MATEQQPFGTLYVLRSGQSDMYKVGITSGTVARRLAQLNTGAAQKLAAVATFAMAKEHAHKCEAFVHARLHQLAARDAGGSEFFRCAAQGQLLGEVRAAWEEFHEFVESVRMGLQDSRDEVSLQLFEIRRELSAEEKRCQVRKVLLEDALIARFTEGVCLGEAPLLSWKKRVCERFDLEAFRRDHPALAAEYTRGRASRSAVFS